MRARTQAATDEELAAQVQNGDDAALGMLIDRYQPKLTRYGRRFLSSTDHIDDVVQDVFIKTYENIKSFETTRRFSPWIYRIAHNAFVNVLRKRSRESLVELNLDTLITHPVGEDPIEKKEREHIHTLIERGIETLSPAYREIIILYYLEDLSYIEIADVLRVPVGTVGVRLKRARTMLKESVEKLEYKKI